jgi:tRNA(fMet)-specific endonuclease VapC
MKYILDTNVLSEAVKSAPNRHVMIMLEKHQAEIATASPVWHELQYGCRRLPVSRKREMIESFLEDVIRQNMIIFPYDERAAKWHEDISNSVFPKQMRHKYPLKKVSILQIKMEFVLCLLPLSWLHLFNLGISRI